MDTRYWGPSGWQLFHLVAFKSKDPDDVLIMMKDILPCKFCRASTTEFVNNHHLRGDRGKWLFDIHNMVQVLYTKSDRVVVFLLLKLLIPITNIIEYYCVVFFFAPLTNLCLDR